MTASRQLFIFLALVLVAANYPEAETDTATAPTTGVTPENGEKLKLGMTRQQVVRLLGGPPTTNVAATDRSSRSPFDAFTSNNEIRQSGELWRSRTCRIWVVFDETNRARGILLERPAAGANKAAPK
jgi:outer membrane protein assembly factor BamE (lipoprotein component of BamABCDE complex)